MFRFFVIITSIASVLPCSRLFSQDRKNAVGLYLEAASTFRFLEIENEFREKYYFPMTVINGGIDYDRRIGKRFIFQTGIGYGRYGYNHRPFYYKSYFHISTHVLKMPLLLRYEIVKRSKITLGAGGGITNNMVFRLSAKSYEGSTIFYPSGNNTVDIRDPKSAEYSYTGFKELRDRGVDIHVFSVGVHLFLNYQINDRLYAALTPNFDYLLQKESAENFYSYGLRLSASYSF